MIDLFKGELLRFRLWAAAAGVINLVVLGFLSRMVDMAQQPVIVYQIFAAVYAVAGILLGLYQMGSYRKPNQWLNLLHRPLHRLQIAGGLSAASVVLLLAAIALPIVLICVYQGTPDRTRGRPAPLVAAGRRLADRGVGLPGRCLRHGRQSPLFVRRLPVAQPVPVCAGLRRGDAGGATGRHRLPGDDAGDRLQAGPDRAVGQSIGNARDRLAGAAGCVLPGLDAGLRRRAFLDGQRHPSAQHAHPAEGRSHRSRPRRWQGHTAARHRRQPRARGRVVAGADRPVRRGYRPTRCANCRCRAA